jgi:hypothetical protein
MEMLSGAFGANRKDSDSMRPQQHPGVCAVRRE